MTELTFDLSLHKTQWELFDDSHRFRVTVNGRRWGKTHVLVHELIMASLQFQGEVSKVSPEIVLGALPTAVQARPIVFKPLVNLFTETALKATLDTSKLSPINHSEMTIYIKDKPPIKIAGANDKNGDGLRGKRLYFVGLDECQDIRRPVFDEVVRPAMSDTKGSRCLITGTPKGKQNILYDFSKMPDVDREWAFFNFPTASNPFIPREEIERAKATLPPRVFNQEYKAEFTTFPGQFFPELDANNKFYGELPPLDLVIAGVDFGDIHPAVSVVGREPISRCWYWLGGWSPNTATKEPQPVPREVFHDKLKQLVERYDVDLIFCDPSRPSEILAIRKLGDRKVYKNTVAAFNGIQSGIGQVSNLIYQNRLLFHCTGENEDDFVDGQLAYDFHQSYHRVSRNGIMTDEPADGGFSHIVDSTRYALAVKGQ